MVRSVTEELRKPRSGRGTLSSRGVDADAGKPDSDGAPGFETFEWPPVQEFLAPLVEAGSQGVDGIPPRSESAAHAPADVRPAAPPPKPRVPPRQEEPIVALRRALRQEASAAKPPDRGTSPWLASRLWIPLSRVLRARIPVPPHTGTIAFVAIALTALLEAAYIVRGLSPQPTPSTANLSPTPLPSGKSSAPSTPQPLAAVASESIAVRPNPERGRLVVRTDPSGAQVFVDGRRHGVTPLTMGNVVQGEHRIVLKRGAAELRQTVRVEPGATTSVMASLQPYLAGSGWIAIASPVEVELFEDGALLGTSRSPQIMLEAGPHTLDLVNETIGYRHTQQVRVATGELVRIDVVLPQSTIHLNALPWAEVWIDGTSVGETPIGNLPLVIGRHEVMFRHPELGEKTLSTLVKAGVPTRVTADFRQQPSKSR
jgi:PEGA domain